MGTSTNAYLAFGIDLGKPGDWRIREFTEDGRFTLPWFTGDPDDFAHEALLHLARERGHDVDFIDDAEEALDLEALRHRHGDHPMYVLAARVVRAWRGDVVAVDFAALERERAERRWDERLISACQVLGITPTQGTPSWVLCSYWSP
ncbi:hypothetical protein [Micromonospora chalcea]|uniref:hypothetical protein n=1 Tax=Micromonospora chalcea TaxID=1874 RepID=UPI003D71E6B7